MGSSGVSVGKVIGILSVGLFVENFVAIFVDPIS